MKIFNFIKKTGDETVCIPITALTLQQAYESFFVAEGYKIEIDTLSPDDDKDQFKLFDMDELKKEWEEGWNKVEREEPI
jgi:hypothetical protein